MDNSKYQIFQKKPELIKFTPFTEEERKNVTVLNEGSIALSCLNAMLILFFVVIFLLLIYFREPIGYFFAKWYFEYKEYKTVKNHEFSSFAEGSWVAAFLITLIGLPLLVTGIVNFFVKRRNTVKAEIAKHEFDNARERDRVRKEAILITENVNNLYSSSITLKAELSKHLEEATLWLEDAESEYKDKAFTPFWDAVENAARHLGKYDTKVNELAYNAQSYYQSLDSREHNFPVFPVHSNTIPDSAFAIKEFRRIVRLGQTNHKFDNNFQHRKTQKILIAGFNSLGDAINSLRYTIEDSLNDFQQIISSDSARIVEEQIKTRETIDQTNKSIDKRLLEQNRMLDNIQHDRKPKLKDIPSKQ